MIVTWSDGTMSINGIYIAFVLNLGEWLWFLYICVLYPLITRTKNSISRTPVDTYAVSASIFKDITALLAACIGCMYWHLGFYRTVITFNFDIIVYWFCLSFLLTLSLLLYKHL